MPPVSEEQKMKALRRPSAIMQQTHLAAGLLQQVEGEKLHVFNEILEGQEVNGVVPMAALDSALDTVLGIKDDLLRKQVFLAFGGDVKRQTIDRNELTARMFSLQNGTLDDALQFAFRMYDVDGDGFIDATEFKNVLRATLSVRRTGSSGVVSHTVSELWVLKTTAAIADEWARTQKSKAAASSDQSISTGLYGYPMLVGQASVNDMKMTIEDFRSIVASHDDMLG